MADFKETSEKIVDGITEDYEKIEEGVVTGYRQIEEGVVSGYKKIESGVVEGYKKIEDKFTGTFLTEDGGLLFALGMCMCLLPEWNAFKIGVVCTAVGAIVLLAQSVVAWIRSGRKIRINWKIAGKVLYGVFAALVLGVGMCMILVWNRMLSGILVGILGLAMVAAAYPLFRSVLRKERKRIAPEILRLTEELLK